MRSIPSLLVAVLWLSGSLLTAQTNRGAIRGSILDPTGATVPGALVHADNVDTTEYRVI
jgi:hypothetical protein